MRKPLRCLDMAAGIVHSQTARHGPAPGAAAAVVQAGCELLPPLGCDRPPYFPVILPVHSTAAFQFSRTLLRCASDELIESREGCHLERVGGVAHPEGLVGSRLVPAAPQRLSTLQRWPLR